MKLAALHRMTESNHDHGSRSLWKRRPRPTYGTALTGRPQVDVCVVGAGIAGISIAYELCRQGADVIVVDQGQVGGGETGQTSAHLTCALDDRFYHLERLHGVDGARLAGASHASAIDLIENNVRLHTIECDFQRVDGYLFAAAGRPADELHRELLAAQRANMACDLVERAPLPFATGPALLFPRQARFEPLAYLDALAAAVVAHRGAIHTGVHVTSIERGTRAPVLVKIGNDQAIDCGAVVDATNTAISSMVRLQMRMGAYRTYVITLEVDPADIGDALYWDTGDPYHYVRLARDGDRHLLVLGGEDHRVGKDHDTADRWTALERWIRDRMTCGAVVDRWSGQIMEPVDSKAFIGKSPDLENVYVVTGDSGHGLTHGVIASVIIPELIAGHDHPWAKLYEPKRSVLRALGTLVREAASSTASYTDWLSTGDVKDVETIPRGAGAVVRRGIHLIAVYRDDDGVIHECNARCPHMSGVVQWNEAERSWDCPAHGSRFDGCGRVLHGPAVGDLTPVPGHEDEKISA